MTNINQTVKATRATFKLGDITLDGYQMPDGCYKLSVTQAAKACNLDHQRLAQIWAKKSLKALLPEGLKVPQTYVKAHVETLDGIRQASLIDLKYVPLLWMECNTPEGKALAYACIVESLERRLDAAFAVERTEEERNTAFTSRVEMVKHWAVEHIEASKQAGQWLPRKWHPEATNAENLLKDKLIEIAQMKDNIAFIRRQNKNKPLDHDAQRKLVIIAQLEDEVEAQGVSC